LIGYIRSMEKYASTPVMMVTSETDMGRLAAVDQIGVSAVVDKPFEATLIKNLIQKIMV
jgi:two-component system chemotaxis response regulator CheY